jgi:hypothetical protein
MARREAWRRLDEDFEETKLVGCVEKSQDWSVPGERKKGSEDNVRTE